MFKTHFLNVGKGSCTIIKFPSNRIGIIDIDDSNTFSEEEAETIASKLNVSDEFNRITKQQNIREAQKFAEKSYKDTGRELTDPINFYKRKYNDKPFRFILTHPDMDHLSGLKRLYEEFGLNNFWDTENKKEIDEDWASSPYNKEDWECYQSLRESNENPKAIFPTRNCSEQYWDEDKVEILSPSLNLIEKANEEDNYHHLSYVLKIEHYGLGILIGGDASYEVWGDLKDYYGEKLSSDILLAPHHGSKNNFHKEAMEMISPRIVIVSVATGKDYAYNKYKNFDSDPVVLSTKWFGNVTVKLSQSGNFDFKTQYN